MCLNIAGCMVNSVDPDQMPCSAASDLGLHCLQKPKSVPKHSIIMVSVAFSFILLFFSCSTSLLSLRDNVK